MAKTSGLGDNLYVGGFNVSGDIGVINQIRGGNAPIEVTGIDKSGHERLGGERDGGIDWTAFFNASAGQEHAVFSALPTADVMVTYARGQLVGNAAACQISKQINYDGKRDNGGNLTFDVSAVSNGFGLEWGVQLTNGLRTDTVATSPATGADLTTVSTAFGWQAYLQVTAFAGTSVTLQLQDSADNSAFSNLGSGGAFTVVTSAPFTQRLVSPGATDTVRRYIRVISTGTFNPATFSVVFVPNSVATVF